MNLYEQFQTLTIDKSAFGLQEGDTEGGYFCTPVGAMVIGWEGTDGIHYCFIDGFDEMVFAVNPMSCAEHYVYPLANDFESFLRMIIASGSAGALEQVIIWSKEDYEEFVADVDKEAAVALQEQLHLEPCLTTYEQVTELQAKFDYSRLVFSEEYYDYID